MDEHGKMAHVCGITIAAASAGQRLYIGSEVPLVVVRALTDAVEASPGAAGPHIEPPALATCREILADVCGPLVQHASPYYWFGPQVQAVTDAAIVRSDGSAGGGLRPLNPGNWGHDEWDQLLSGGLGPWVMALLDGMVISICHTPRRMSERAAECGVWTRPEYRARGYAAAVTAAWADTLRPSGRHLFYSADAQNVSSQRVAARLGLRPIGWTWNLTRTSTSAGVSQP